jgi:class 3 adenylate cyclase
VQVVRNINPADWFASAERKAELQRLAQEAKEKEKQKRVQASRLGKILADQTTRRVIVGVLSMMVVSPFLETEIYDIGPEYGLELLFLSQSECAGEELYFETGLPGDKGCNSSSFSREAWEFLVYEFAHQSKGYYCDYFACHVDKLQIHAPLIWLRVPDFRHNGQVRDVEFVETLRCQKSDWDHPYRRPPEAIPDQTCKEGTCCWASLPSCADVGSPEGCPWRQSEVRDVAYTPPPCEDPASSCYGLVLRAKFLVRYSSEWKAFASTQQTTFIIFLLGLGSVSFSRDTQSLVVAPIERMVNIVKQLADDPLRKPVVQNEEEEEDVLNEEQKKPTGQLETAMLETTILKIGGLLRVGFGEAGAQIIGGSMASEDGDLDIQVAGRKVIAIYSFCKVSDFVDATDCLQEEVMVFVNKIAKIVHTCAHEWSGAANKNIGDTFFLTWMLMDSEAQAVMLRDGIQAVPMMSELIDRALLSLVKIIAESRRASDLAAYAKHPKIIPRFGMSFRVNLSFGLNVGWSVEGAIGSQHKIDASYISPHVNIAARLESVTKVYGSELLMSEHIANNLSQRARDRCRRIDTAKLKPSAAPLGIYCFDVNRDVVTLAPESHQVSGIIPPPEITHAELLSRGLEGYWQLDQDVVQLQEGITGESWRIFSTTWDQAFRYYVSGQWNFCVEVLHKFSQDYPAFDGPTQAMSSFILSYDLEPPSDWNGVRTVRTK